MGFLSDSCPNCGESVKKGAKFCSRCGANLIKADEKAKDTEASSQSPLTDGLARRTRKKLREFEEKLNRHADKHPLDNDKRHQ